MGKCIIFCAGEFTALAAPVGEEDYLIAADGGLRHLQSLRLTPHAILGDFDSLGFTPENATVFPVEKDDTDTMLAVRKGLSMGYKEFLIYGALDGPRLDHTIANLQTLQFLAENGSVGYLVGNTYIATILQNSALSFPESAAGILSVFCWGKEAKNVSLAGLKYPLQNGVLTNAYPLGVSNHFIGKPAKIEVSCGSLLLLYDRENGFPQREVAK